MLSTKAREAEARARATRRVDAGDRIGTEEQSCAARALDGHRGPNPLHSFAPSKRTTRDAGEM